MSRTSHSRPTWAHRCWWCDEYHRSALGCPHGTQRVQRRQADRDMRDAINDWANGPRRVDHPDR